MGIFNKNATKLKQDYYLGYLGDPARDPMRVFEISEEDYEEYLSQLKTSRASNSRSETLDYTILLRAVQRIKDEICRIKQEDAELEKRLERVKNGT